MGIATAGTNRVTCNCNSLFLIRRSHLARWNIIRDTRGVEVWSGVINSQTI